MSVRSNPAWKWLVAWLVALAVLAAFHLVVVARAHQSLETCRGQVAAKVDRYNLLRDAKSPQQQERLREQLDELTRQYTDLVFDSNGLSSLDFEIRGMAEQHGLSDFSSRRVGTTATIGASKLTRIAQRELVLSCAGSFPDVLQFINALERHYPVVFVDQCTLKAGTARETPGPSCTMECSLLYETTNQ
jgi:hypothetical protein